MATRPKKISSSDEDNAESVTPERRAWWRKAARQMDEMRALHAARDALPAAPMPEPLPPRDYSRATALFGAETAAALKRVDNGRSLYDALYPDGDPEWNAYEAASALRAAEREANPEFYRAEEEKARLAHLQRRIEEKVADESKMRLSREQLKSGMKLEKKNIPCARLYSCVGDKRTGGAKPTTRHVSSECWSHERIDPETGELLTPHKCPWLHPGEPGWLPQWNTDRLFKPAAPAPPPQHRMAAALAAAPRAPWARAASPPRKSRGTSADRLRSVQRANKQARNRAEEKALSALNRRESRNAAAAIFSNKSKKNKPKWGIPNLGTGFGGGRTRRNSYKRRG
jgi:hypothetical protein